MRPLLEWCSAVALSRFSIVIPITIGVVGCSDSSRFNDPYAARGPGPEVTSSVPPAQPAPVGRVDAQPMPPPGPADGAPYSGGSPYYGYGPGAGAPPPRGPDYAARPSDADYSSPNYADEYPPPNYPRGEKAVPP
jgi:hypothetical protein